jgi:hypothetical protein
MDPNNTIQMAWHDSAWLPVNALFHTEITNAGTSVGTNFRIDRATFRL